MKKTKKDFLKYLEEKVEYYKEKLGINNDIDFKELEESSSDYLSISFRYPYNDYRIFYSNNFFNDWLKGDFNDKEILHELCHILTDPLYSKAISRYVSKDEISDERERLTDTISDIVEKLSRNK